MTWRQNPVWIKGFLKSIKDDASFPMDKNPALAALFMTPAFYFCAWAAPMGWKARET